MNVLSLFDGMSCGRIALDRAGVKVDTYYASELDKYAMQVATANYPDTVQLGDVTKWREWNIDWGSIDLVLGGSPCQGFSFAGKQLAFDDPRSALFFVYLEVLEHVRRFKPDIKFLLENVKMKREHLEVITERLGVNPVFINSALVSAQNRQRYYWANFSIVQPEDRGISLSSILETEVSPDWDHTAQAIEYMGRVGSTGRVKWSYMFHSEEAKGKSQCVTANFLKGVPNNVFIEKTGRIRKFTPIECERLQTVPDNYTSSVSNTQRYKMLGNGWTIEVIAHIFRGLPLAGEGSYKVLADLDFETYSEAGYTKGTGKWTTLISYAKSGIGCVGAARYAQDETTHLWSLAYDLKDGIGKRLWVPGCPPPQDLFDHIARGVLLEAHNSEFEYFIWKYVCHERLGWPELPLAQLRCSAGKARAHGLPGALGEAAKAARVQVQKMTEGKRLIRKFCQPQNPTKKQPLEKLDPALDPIDGAMFYEYNMRDIEAEASLSAVVPDITGPELEVWMTDKRINARGVQVDAIGMAGAISVVNEAIEVETRVLTEITEGTVDSANKNAKFIAWLRLQGADMPNMQKETVAAKLNNPGDMAPLALQALKIRDAIGGSAVKKLFALERYIMSDDRVRGIFLYHGAHTGRWSGTGPQPQNFPNSGPSVFLCPCGAYRDQSVVACPCGRLQQVKVAWDPEAVDEVLRLCQYGYQTVARFFPKPLEAVSGCLRGLFCSAPGHELICSDYSAIEAVVLAMIAGESWREEVFRDHGMIYEMSASKISGIPFEDFVRYKEEHGAHHPLRKTLGKVSELASGYGGGLGAWKNFGADKFMTDIEIEAAKTAWRKESPMIVKFWYAAEDAAKNAIKYPGSSFNLRGFEFKVVNDILCIRLLSGRILRYHEPVLVPGLTPWGAPNEEITFMWEDSKTKKWVRTGTYGGCLTENLCQAVARDILAFAMVNLDKAGYPIVLHVHDEPVSEVPEGFGSVDEYERIMMALPDWCSNWPIKASGGWRGKRYRK